jgi:hypothetical protein
VLEQPRSICETDATHSIGERARNALQPGLRAPCGRFVAARLHDVRAFLRINEISRIALKVAAKYSDRRVKRSARRSLPHDESSSGSP